MTNVRAVLLMKMINKVLRRWMPHTNTHTERRATSFFYHGGDETTDQSRLSAAWQRRKSEGVIEEVSWPCGAVSVACLSGGRHWWTVEAERERERESWTSFSCCFHPCLSSIMTQHWPSNDTVEETKETQIYAHKAAQHRLITTSTLKLWNNSHTSDREQAGK